jgi:hypothetical protein
VRNRLAPFLAFLLAAAAIVAACGGSSGTDPYELLSKASKATRDPVQINVGFALKDGSTTISIEPSAVALVVNSGAGTGALHVAVPASVSGLDADALAQLGLTGDTVDFDLLYDGEALYTKSPLMATVITRMLAQSGELPPGDLTDWLRLGTKADLEALAAMAGGGAMPSFAPPSAGDAATLKKTLEDAGVTVTFVATESHDGTDAHHLTVALDYEKFFASSYFDSVSPDQVADVGTALKDLTLSIDLWVDKASNNLNEITVHGVSTSHSSQSADLIVKFGDPDGSVSLEAPAAFVDIPFNTLLGGLLQLFGPGLTGG